MVFRPRTKAKILKKQRRCPKCGKLIAYRKRCKTCHRVVKR